MAAALAGVQPGCGGSDASVNGGGGGDDAASDGTGGGGDDATGGGDDASPSDGASNGDSNGGSDAYCNAVAAYDQRCGLTTACDTARAAQCTQTDVIFNDAVKQAYVDCEPQHPCTGDAGPGSERAYAQCLYGKYPSPTATQTTLANAFCAKCQSILPQCPQDFYRLPVDGGFGLGEGVPILELTDAVVTQIQSQCLDPDGGVDAGGGGTCTQRFFRCAQDVARSSLPPPPAACRDN